MKKPLLVRYLLLTLVLGLFAVMQASAQMKIGDNPTQINKSSILELESNQQGLLLTRISDFTKINTLIGTNNVDGMIVYYTGTGEEGEGLYMRKGGNWVKVASASDAAKNWSLEGNAGTDPTKNFLGTTDAQPLVIKTDNTERLRFTEDGKIKTNAVGTGATTDLTVLVIQSDGTIVKRTLPADIFTKVVTGITDGTNNLTNTDVKFQANADSSYSGFEVKTDAGTNTANINAPIMSATAITNGADYGFMTKADWDKLNNMAGINDLSIGNLILTAANDPEIAKGAKITNDGSGNYTINLIEADATHNGVVSTNAQTFAGEKTFNDKVTAAGQLAVDGVASLNGGATVGTSSDNKDLTVNGNATVTGDGSIAGNTTLGSNTSGTVTINNLQTYTPAIGQNTIPTLVVDGSNQVQKIELTSAAFKNITLGNVSGTDASNGTGINGLNIDNSGTNLVLNVPDANTGVRGVVNTTAQSFDGVKTFNNDLNVGTSGTSADLNVTGAGDISGNATVGGTLDVTGKTTLNNTLDVKDDATLEKSVTLTTAPTAATAASSYNVLVRNSTSGILEQTSINADAGKPLEIGTEAGTVKDLHIDRTTDATKIIIQAPDATTDVRGVVNHTDQTFGGNKTFADNLSTDKDLAVTGTSTLTGAATLSSTLEVTGITTLKNTLNATGDAVFGTSTTGTVALANQPAAATADGTTNTFNVLTRNNSTGVIEQTQMSTDAGKPLKIHADESQKDLYIKKDADSITIEVPDAGAGTDVNTAIRGVINTTNQSFRGEKTFVDNTQIGTDRTDATTTGSANLTVNGAVALAVQTSSGPTTITLDKIHTLLADASSGPITVNLPTSPTDGTVYTIKITANSSSLNDVTVNGSFGDGHPKMIFWNAGSSRTVQYQGGKWYIIAQ